MEEKILWILLTICNSLIPITALIGGFWFVKYASKKRSVFGYRTKRSLQNDETWRFAQSCCGMIWEMIGISTLVPTWMLCALGYFMTLKQQCILSLVLVTVQMVILFIGTSSVDRSIKQHFDEEGHRIIIDEIIEDESEDEEEEVKMKEILFGISKEEQN